MLLPPVIYVVLHPTPDGAPLISCYRKLAIWGWLIDTRQSTNNPY